MGYREVRAQRRPVALNQDEFVISPPIQIMSGEVGVCHDWEGGLLASHGQRDAVKHPMVHREPSHRESSGSKCRSCQDLEREGNTGVRGPRSR